MGDVLATDYWAAQISAITQGDTVPILGAGPIGLCALQCVCLHRPKPIIVCDVDESRLAFVRQHYPEVLTTSPAHLKEFVLSHIDHGAATVVLESNTFRMHGLGLCLP